jgi:uncharacterized protein (TIGR01777 family)
MVGPYDVAMRVLITGSTGLLGSALVPALTKAGHEPVRLRRGTDARAGELRWDPTNSDIDDLTGIDAVVHFAGIGIGDKKWSDDQKRALVESRTIPTRLLAEAMATAVDGPRILLSGSAIGYYGNRGDEKLTEASGPGSDFQADLCVAWEEATAAAQDAGIRTCHLRTAVVQTADGGTLARQLLPFKLGIGGRFGPGTQWFSWISMEDEMRAILHLLDNDISGPVNLASPNPVTNNEFTKTLGKVVNRPTLLPTPLLPIKAVYGNELVETLMLGSLRVVGDKLLESGFEFSHPDLESALRATI